MKVIKTHGKWVKAYQLGTKHPVLEQLIEIGKIVVQKDGNYRILSQETVNGEGLCGIVCGRRENTESEQSENSEV